MRRYGVLTSIGYDVLSGERPLYRPARLEAIARLRLRRGDSVVVLGAGTGLDLPPLARALGPSGLVVAVDDSPAMLRRSAGRQRRGWPEVRLVQADLTRARSVLPPDVGPVDAVLAVNTLSLIPDWRAAWARGVAAARPGARIAVADIGRPDGGTAIRAWAPLISAVGLGRLDAHPWQAVEEDATDVSAASWHHGHVQLRAGTLP
ncbi:class I SAM-dependent methyltransferase [Amnibacterium endophyticum]|uniref:Class I SAM-dependent methyltransferase n=1 Tax=Amnibacterium endophyticum TaxID=2109337 RepID=A0ABW4LB34_9MICO